MSKITCDTKSCLLCTSCLPEWRELTALKKQTRQFKKGERIFTEGDPVTGIFFTLSGAVKVHKQWGEQKELIIRFVSGNDVIGVRGFGDTVLRASATALETTIACFIPNEHLQASLMTNAAFSYKLMQFYATELQKAEQRMSDLANLDAKGRTASALLLLKDTFGLREDGYINITVSRQDIASYAGTIYETVFKIFTEWIASSFIQTEGKHMKILNEDGLRAFIPHNH